MADVGRVKHLWCVGVVVGLGCNAPNPEFDGPVVDGDADGAGEGSTTGLDGGDGDAGETGDGSGTGIPGKYLDVSVGDGDGDGDDGKNVEFDCDDQDPDLIACYDFEHIDNGELRDGSNHGNDGFAEGASTTDGIVGKAMYTKEASMVGVPPDPSLDLFVGMTIEYWVRLEVHHTDSWVVYKEGGFDSYVASDGRAHCNTPYGATSGGNVAASWSHIACTAGDGWVRVYQDGKVVGEAAAGNPTIVAGTPMMLASRPGMGGDLHGAVDNMRIWRVTRSSQDICAAAGKTDC